MFNETVGCVPGEVDIKLDPKVTPVVNAARPVPAAIREQVKTELDHLEKCKIIKKVTEPTEWVNPLICVKKTNGRVRLCIDPGQLNKAIQREHYPMSTIEDISTRLQGSKYFFCARCKYGILSGETLRKKFILYNFQYTVLKV